MNTDPQLVEPTRQPEPTTQPANRRRIWRWLAGAIAVLTLAVGAFGWWLLPGVHTVKADVTLPARFVDGLIFVEPETRSGEKLTLLTDTGGGLYVTAKAAERTGMPSISLFGARLARLPEFRTDAWIPEVTGAEEWMAVAERDGDGMLGQRWFAGGVWTFDYPAKKLILRHQPHTISASQRAHAIPLGFLRCWGIRTRNHPRITLRIDDQPIDALLDTGATVWLTPEAMQIVGEPAGSERATSFVSAALFGRWHAAHPDWRIIKKGCEKSGADLIEVPEVEVSGLRAGPVWFTQRGEGSYTWMSTFMDRPIAASLGGNFFGHYRLTIDYPNATAYLEE